MNLTQLGYFVELVNQKSITKAAQACFISYNAMHKSLKSMETELNVTLVNRDSTGITLTPEGKIFYQDVLKMLEIASGWSKLSNRENKLQEHVIKICTTPLFVKNGTLNVLADRLAPHNIFLDYDTFYPEYMESIMAQVQSKNLFFLLAHSPQKYNAKNLVKQYQQQNHQVVYLCSDDCKVYLHNRFVENGKLSFVTDELVHFKQIVFTHRYNALTSFDSTNFLSKEHTIVQSYDECIDILLHEKSFSLLRSSVEDHIHEKYSNDIVALPLRNFFSGSDYYLAFPRDISPQEQIFVDELRKYCAENYSTQKYFE